MTARYTAVVLPFVIILGSCLTVFTGCSSGNQEQPDEDIEYAYDYVSGFLAAHPLDEKNEEMLLVRLQRAGLTRKEAKTQLEKLQYKTLLRQGSAGKTAKLERKVSYSPAQIKELMNGIHWGSDNYQKILKGLSRARTELEAKIAWIKAGDRFLQQDRITSLMAHPGYILSIAASPDWSYFAGAGRRSKTQGLIKLIQPASGITLHSFQAQQSHYTAVSITCVAISRDNKYLAASGEYEVILWNLDKQYRERSWRLDNSPSAVSISSDNKYVAVGKDGKRREVHIFKLKSGKRYKKLKGYTTSVKAIAFSPGNKTLATIDGYRSFILWDLKSGQKLRVIKGYESNYQFDVGMALSPDGNYLAAAAGSLVVLDPLTGKTIRELSSGGRSGSLAISGNNRYIAGTSQGRPLRIWKFETGELVKSIGLSNATNPWVSLSPDGNYVAAVSGNNYIQVWALNRVPAVEECYRRAGLGKTGWLRIAGYYLKNEDPLNAAVYFDKAGESIKAKECRETLKSPK